jgi:hypothetical protein
MDVNELVEAARLAESLSTFRHKKVRLVLASRGIVVEGELIRPDGVVILEERAEAAWSEVEGGTVLGGLIREVNRKLVYEWTHAEPEDDH